MATKTTVGYTELTIDWNEIMKLIEGCIAKNHPEFVGKPYCFNLGYTEDRAYPFSYDRLNSITFRSGERPDDYRKFNNSSKPSKDTW